MLKIIVDENIAFADRAFNSLGKVELVPGRSISNQLIKDADILIVRSITKVDRDLLRNTKVKFVGTATIGTDHIDLDYLKENKIVFADAKGCNAYSVAEYVIAALTNLAVKLNLTLRDKSIGIIGVGNIGSKVAGFTTALGMDVILNDPPLKRLGDTRIFAELDQIFECDIVTLHVPLNLTGEDKTFHLFDFEKLKKLKTNSILINTSRGAVINNSDLLKVIDKKHLNVVLDVWENEPDVNIELLKKIQIGTPHIAGYSYEGKVNGTKMIYDSLCNFLGAENTFSFDLQVPENSVLSIQKSGSIEERLNKLISNVYSITKDDLRMREMINMPYEKRGIDFDKQRKNYPTRREFINYLVLSDNLTEEEKKLLSGLRFQIS